MHRDLCPNYNVDDILFSYKRVEVNSFYTMIEQVKLSFPILFHHYPTSIIGIEFRAELPLYEIQF